MDNSLFSEKHFANLPTIRIAKIEISNFRSVKHGEIVLNCGKKFIPYGTVPDITGIYGQNGSGKTSVIYSIGILKELLSGESIPEYWADFISVDAESAELQYTFDIQYPNGREYESNNDVRKLVYSVKLAKVSNEKKEVRNIFADKDINDYFVPEVKHRVVVVEESIKIAGTVCGEKTPLKPYIDTSGELSAICPKTKMKLLVGEMNEDKRVALGINKSIANTNSKSLVFLPEMIDLYSQNSNYSFLYQMIIELQLWAQRYLYCVDSNTYSFTTLNAMILLYIDDEIGMYPIPTSKPFDLDSDLLDDVKKVIDSISCVVQEIVPGLSIKLNDYGVKVFSDGEPVYNLVELMVVRDGKEMPFRYESDGIKKLVATMFFITQIYNQKSMTVAYDEFDSGVFEYLLGEILHVIKSSGKGQLIFTSHNLYPLTILGKDHIYFTTNDPDNRFIKLTGIGGTNNLRTVYLREIGNPERYDNLYNETKRNLIKSAMRKTASK